MGELRRSTTLEFSLFIGSFPRKPFNEESYSSPYRIGDSIRNTGLAARDNCLDRLQCTPQGYESTKSAATCFFAG